MNEKKQLYSCDGQSQKRQRQQRRVLLAHIKNSVVSPPKLELPNAASLVREDRDSALKKLAAAHDVRV